ncbi:MAG: SufE family protein [Candidatus Heimdallarchaeota archaeon]|nr:SufE family protein [Candidatus Heimdallarchaeota archaeon]
MTNEIPDKLSEILEEFKEITSERERAELLIYYSELFNEVPKHIAQRPFDDENKVPGCESEAYVWLEIKDGKVNYYFAVENPHGISAKAMAAILDTSLNGEDPAIIKNISSDIVYELFGRNVAMGRGMGLTSMVELVRFLAKNQSN